MKKPEVGQEDNAENYEKAKKARTISAKIRAVEEEVDRRKKTLTS